METNDRTWFEQGEGSRFKGQGQVIARGARQFSRGQAVFASGAKQSRGVDAALPPLCILDCRVAPLLAVTGGGEGQGSRDKVQGFKE
ncbi:MAG: hypothetical protein C0613_15000 [Desulfobulbaceae bacterium]|nr:MAG: hypothetical protein C0613_15000 [Desulfobulbaceae bacterium]